MFYFLFFDQVKRDNGEEFVKKSSVDPFHEERDYHGEFKSCWSYTVSRKVIKSFQRKHRLLYIFFLTSEYAILFTPEIYFCFCSKKQQQQQQQKNPKKQNKKTIVFSSGCKTIVIRNINCMTAFWSSDEGV